LEKETAMILPGLLLIYEWIFRVENSERSNPSSAFPLHAPSPQTRGGSISNGQAPTAELFSSRTFAWLGGALQQIWPYFLVVVFYVPARIYALKGFNHVVTPLSTQQLVFTWPSLIAFWIRHLVWPVGLSTFYDFPSVVRPTLQNFILPAIFDLAVALGVFACVRRSRQSTFFAVWLALPLIPLLNLRVFVADDFAHDRYLYLPSVGLAVLVAMLLQKLCAPPTHLLAAGVCLAVALSFETVAESAYFKDNLTFYEHNLAVAPHNPYAESNYAIVLAEDGQYAPAVDRFLDVVNRYPYYWNATFNLALTYYKMAKLTEAENYFLRAIRIDPGKPSEYFYLGMTRLKEGRAPDAITAMRHALELRPNGFAYHLALGLILKTQGDRSGALGEFQQELANNPDEAAARAQIEEIENGGSVNR
jgi:tetratricopeptide (TPR) repeat protein